jgi:hypothetical protein
VIVAAVVWSIRNLPSSHVSGNASTSTLQDLGLDELMDIVIPTLYQTLSDMVLEEVPPPPQADSEKRMNAAIVIKIEIVLFIESSLFCNSIERLL